MRFLVLIAMAVLSASTLAQEIENPLYRDWAAHRVGTMVKYSIITVRKGYRMEVQRSARLVSIRPEKLLLEESAAMEAGDSNVDFPASKIEIPARTEASSIAAITPAATHGEEKLNVGNAELLCAWREQRTESTTTKTWSCDKIPGGLVREEISRLGELLSTTTMLVRFEEG